MTTISNYSLVFSDEFDTLSLSDGKTATANWYTAQAWGGGFGDAKFMPAASAASPFSIVRQGDASALQIELTRGPTGQLQSGLISNTFPDGTSKTVRDGNPFGYYETRMWLPDGQGVWPAFWAIEKERLSPTRDHVFEIDIMEQHGADLGDRYASHVHDWDWGNGKLEGHSSQYLHNVTGKNVLTTGWHTYGVEIRPDKMTFYMDGAAHFTIATPATLNTDLMFMFDLAAGGGWKIDPNLNHQKMLIDYFRVYELKPDVPLAAKTVLLQGKSGNDTHHIFTSGVAVNEAAGAGFDAVRSSVSYALDDNVEKLVLTGSSHLNGSGNIQNNELHGNAGDNRLSGLGGNDHIYAGDGSDSLFGGDGDDKLYGGNGVDVLDGGAGADRLEGGAGADVAAGGAGNDFYIVDDLRDVVTEALNAGRDSVQSSVSHTLSANVETLTLTGMGDLAGYGNALDNMLTGNAGANLLDGGGGSDRLAGGAGNDTYIVDSAVDRVVETASAGFDTVRSSVSFTLSNDVEALILTGASAINATGSAAANTLTGNAAANVLNGLAGSDVLIGGAGADSFVFTTALGPLNVDRIQDFVHGVDKIVLENAVFRGLSAGALSADVFALAGQPFQADDRIIFDGKSGALFFDADGSGASAAIRFATVAAETVLDRFDFTVI